MKTYVFYIFFYNLVSLSVFSGDEQTEQQKNKTYGQALNLYIENDSRKIGGPGSDQAFSNGFKISYILAENHIPFWALKIFPSINIVEEKIGPSKVNFGLSLNHQIYTPNNTKDKNLILNDRPYAAWFYVGLLANFRRSNEMDSFEFDFGTVGPNAFGKSVQNGYHKIIHEEESKGWSNGLKNEMTLQLEFQKKNRRYATSVFDLFSYYGLGLGNVAIGSHLGILIRYGLNLPSDFGPSRPSTHDGDSFISPNKQTSQFNSYYVFAGTRGNYSLRNIFLDGNSIELSHHVTKYPFNFETDMGFGISGNSMAVVWRFVTKSPEFEQRSLFNSFASISLTFFLN